MYCPKCNAATLETSLHCQQCGASQVASTVGDSLVVQTQARRVHLRIGGNVGGIIGFALFIMLSRTVFESMYWSTAQELVGASVAAGLGRFCGRWLVYRHYRINHLI